MALKPCKSCKHQVDAKAKTCPNCGVSDPGVTLVQKLLGFALLIVVVIVAVKACGGGDEKTGASVNPAPVEEKVVIKALGITPEQYTERVNAMVAAMDKPPVSDVQYEDGKGNDAFSAKLGPYVSLVGTVSKTTGEMLSVIVLVAGDGSPKSGVDILFTASAALAAAAGTDHKTVLGKLTAIAQGTPEIFGDVKVSFSETKGVAMWFTASPI